MTRTNPCRLYLITPPSLPDVATFAVSLLPVLEAGEVACLQVRLKDAGDEDICKAVDCLLPLSKKVDCALILNDRPDLAAKTGCDGVHVGLDDMPYDQARAMVGDNAIVGVSCKNSRHLAMSLADAGADYVAFGAFFASSTKKTAVTAPLELLEIWSETTTVPCVAIGGITTDNCVPVISAGADFLAVSAGVWGYPDGPLEAARLFREHMAI